MPAARIVPDVASFSVDDGFWYAIGEGLGPLRIGSVVRIPLSGRRVRGFVVELGEREAGRLKPVAALSGEGSIFDPPLLDALRGAAMHYVAPVATLLGRATPPNVPPGDPGDAEEAAVDVSGDHVFADLVAAAREARHRAPVAWVGAIPVPDLARLGADLRREGGSLLVVVATAAEAEALASRLQSAGLTSAGSVHGEDDDRRVTATWARLRHRGGVVIGTPRVAAWAVRAPAVAVVVEEGRRAMKDRQTPTVHVRDLLRARSRREGMPLLCLGPTPTVELAAAGAELRRPEGRPRAWGQVEVVDRRRDPPGGGLLSETTRQALRAVAKRGGRTFVYAHRRAYAAALRCVGCRTLRRCPSCGSRPDPGDRCRRCGAALGPCPECGGERFEPLGAGVGRVIEEVSRVVGAELVAEYPSDAPTTVGTERDLVTLEHRDLVILVDLDGLVFATNYRAAEEALRIGARLANRVAPGSGHRLIVQTSEPEHPVAEALRRGDPEPFLRHELAEREALGYPPAAQLLVVEIRGDIDTAEATAQLTACDPEAMVMGPAPGREGERWLVQGPDLSTFKANLRPVVRRLRDADATVRIDADPIDL